MPTFLERKKKGLGIYSYIKTNKIDSLRYLYEKQKNIKFFDPQKILDLSIKKNEKKLIYFGPINKNIFFSRYFN